MSMVPMPSVAFRWSQVLRLLDLRIDVAIAKFCLQRFLLLMSGDPHR